MQRTINAILTAALALASGGVLAQAAPERGWYGGLAAGRSQLDFGRNFARVAGATASTTSQDDGDAGYKIYGGYRFGRHFALEGGYSDFGSFSFRRNVTAPTAGTATANVQSRGTHFDVVGIVPLGQRFELFGKLGLIRAVTTTRTTTTGSVVVFGTGEERDIHISPRIGAGAEFRLTPKLALRLEYEDQNLDFQFFDERKSVQLLSLGLKLRFP
jgi:OOP family OmpA-OmpF porin